MKKRLSFVLAMILVVSALTGCIGQNTSIKVNPDGTCEYTFKYMYEKSYFQDMVSDTTMNNSPIGSGDFVQSEETVGNMTYKTFSRTVSFASIDALKTTLTNQTAYIAKLKEGSAKPDSYTTETITSAPFQSMTLDNNTFIASIAQDSGQSGLTGSSASSSSDVSSSLKQLKDYGSVNAYYKSIGLLIDYSITLPSVITESNGTIIGNTVTWSTDTIPADGTLIASVSGGIISADTESPVITGVSNGKLTKKPVTLKVTDNLCLKSVLVNGINVGTGSFMVAKSGKYTVTAVDANNNETSVKFQVDTKAPKIKGIKQGKISKKGVTVKFSDNVGIKSAKINGKKVSKKKVRLKKAGKYVIKLTDKAGNTTKVSFRIVKR